MSDVLGALLINRKLWIVLKFNIAEIEWLLGNHPSMDNAAVQKI